MAESAAATTGKKDEGSLERVLCISMNDDRSLFAVGTTFGFHVFNTYPIRRRYFRDWGSGVGIIEVYKRSNIVVLVGSEAASRFSSNKLTIWDDNGNRVVADVDFHNKIVAVHLRRDRIIVAVQNSVSVLNFKDLSTLATYSATMDPFSLAVSQMSEYPIIAFSDFVAGASSRRGVLKIKRENPAAAAKPGTDGELGSDSMASDLTQIPAHDGPIVCVGISQDGKLAATASDKGTLVRVWDTETGQQVKELRRGAEQAKIWSICFSNDNSLLAVASSRGTCHIFGIVGVQNKQSMFWSIRSVLPSYFDSEWSSMQIPVPSEPSYLSFGPDNKSLFVISSDGTYRRIELKWGGDAPSATLDSQTGAIKFLQENKA